MSKKLLITGGTGFVAYHIIEAALQDGYDVYVSVRNTSSTAHLKAFDIKYTAINFSDIASIENELKEKQYNYIIHSAGTTRAKNRQEYNEVNAVYTANLAKAAVSAGIPLKKFVFVSSLAAVGPNEGSVYAENSFEFAPVTSYGKSKLLAEKMLSEIEGLPLIIIRPTAVYGPREKDIFIVFKTLSKGIEPYIGTKPQQMSFVYVKDLAQLIVSMLGSAIRGRAYNISDGNIYDRYALAKNVKAITGNKTVKFYLPVPVVKMMAGFLELAGSLTGKVPALNRPKIKELTASWNYSIDAAKKDFGFNPVYNLESGLKETISWYKQNKWL